MELLLYISAPAVILVYKVLDYFKLIDKLTKRSLQLSALKRLKNPTGYPDGWIFNDPKDAPEFEALYKLIKKRTESKKLETIFKDGYSPSLITVGGTPFHLDGLDPNWAQNEKAFYSNNHPIMIVFGIDRSGGEGKGEKACTLGELEKWIEDEKRNIEFWVGSFTMSILAIGLIVGRVKFKQE
jgi:hypothetical protein